MIRQGPDRLAARAALARRWGACEAGTVRNHECARRGARSAPCSAVVLNGRRTDRHQVDHVREVRLETARDRALAAFEDLALDVHLPEPPLGVVLRAGD